MTCGHVTHAPTLIRHGLANLLQQLLVDLSRGKLLGNRDQILHGQQAHGVLIVGLEAAIDGETIAEDVRLGQVFDQGL